MEHAELVVLAGKWLKAQGCGVVITEMTTIRPETPDAIGFKADCSWLIECKTSRSDFHADSKKHHRKYPETGMGDFRYYMSEPNIVTEEDLPLGWGLLHVVDGKIKKIRGMRGNCGARENGMFHFLPNIRAERSILISALRRKLAPAPQDGEGKEKP